MSRYSASPSTTCALSKYSKNESHPAPMPPERLVHVPRRTSSVFPNKSKPGSRMLHSARTARFAAVSNRASPVSLDNTPNSRVNDPTAATFVSVVSPGRTPWRRFTHAYGMPVAVSNARRSRSPRSSAIGSNAPSYPGTKPAPIEGPTRSSASPCARACAERRPPRTRMLHSNALTRTSTSKSRFLESQRTFLANSVALPSTASVLVASIRVSATPSYVSERCSLLRLPSSPSESVCVAVIGRSSSCGNACST